MYIDGQFGKYFLIKCWVLDGILKISDEQLDMVNLLAWIVSTRLCRWPIWKIVLNGILKIYDGQLDVDNLLAWRASSFFLDKQISTLQISASPTQRHILSKEIPYSFPWASFQTANLSIFLLYPPTASYHHHQRRSITFLWISLKKLINCRFLQYY